MRIQKTNYSSLFNNLSTSKSNNASTNFNWLSDYASLKNGSYSKLMKAYYTQADSEVKSGKASSSQDILKKLKGTEKVSEVSQDEKTYNKVSTDANALQESLKKIRETDLSDKEKAQAAVQNFVDSYNALVKSASDVDDKSVTNRLEGLENNTKVNEKSLNAIGISIEKDGTLKLNEDTFKAADPSKTESLFKARGSYGYSTNVSAAMVQSNAKYAASSASTYTNSGKYNTSNGSMFDSYF
jgi:hypothetical protein